MDERHWWITTKLQKTLHIGMFDEPTLLEDFMSERGTVCLLDMFFLPTGDKALFFYLRKSDQENSATFKEIHIATSSSENLAEVLNNIYLCVYFIRECIETEVQVHSIEHDVMSGELNQNGLILYSDILQNVFVPLVKNTGILSDVLAEEKNTFLVEMEKYSQVLQEFSSGTLTLSAVLKLPDKELHTNFKKKRQEALNPKLLLEYEQLVTDWINSVENVVMDTLDDKHDLYCSPQSMVTEWRQKLKILQGVVDELKNKEIKLVIGVLVIAKSKTLRNWKIIDSCLTDALNDVKDRVKYLEALRKCFEHLEHESNFHQLCNTVLPELLSNIRLLDSISKFYAKVGFLGSILAKVSHQLVVLCSQHVQSYVFAENSEDGVANDGLWNCVSNEVLHRKAAVDKTKSKGKLKNVTSTGILNMLYTSLSIINYYRDVYYTLKEGLGGANNLQYNSAIGSRPAILKKLAQMKTNTTGGSFVHSSPSMSIDETRVSIWNTDVGCANNPGTEVHVPFSDEKTIMRPLTIFNKRVDQLIDIIESTKQFHKLVESAKELPLLTESQLNGTEKESDENELIFDDVNKNMTEKDSMTCLSKTLNNLCEDAVSIIKKDLTYSIFVDIESSTKERFEKLYSNFVKVSREIEEKIEQYVVAVFELEWRTEEALKILLSFQYVLNRPALSSCFQTKYSYVLSKYEEDLEYIERRYEMYKDQPEAQRNMPLVSSALYWSHGLFTKIEDSMKMLKTVKIVTNLKGYKNVIRSYNRLITVFSQYEEIWLSTWLTQTESCMKLLHSTLLANEATSGKVVVYADPSVLELFSDVKLLRRLGIKIPSHLLEFCAQEQKYKFYKQTLDYLVGEYYAVCDQIPAHLQMITNALCKATLLYFQPALTVLRWDSVNVDAFLFKVEQVINEFQKTVKDITTIANEITEMIQCVQNVVLFEKPKDNSKVWTPHEFEKSQKYSITTQGALLNTIVINIESALQNIVSIVTKKNQTRSESSHTLHKSNSQAYAASLLQANPSDMTIKLFTGDKKIVADLFLYYSKEVFKAVKNSIRLSLHEYMKCVRMDTNVSFCQEPIEQHTEHFRFAINLAFSLPTLVLIPLLSEVQDAVSNIRKELINISTEVYWWDATMKQTFNETIQTDKDVVEINTQIDKTVIGLQGRLTRALTKFYHFSFLWLEDMNSLYEAFEEEKTDEEVHHKEVKYIINVENQIRDIEDKINIDVIVFDTTLIKDSLCGFCSAWKMCYVQKLHQIAKGRLDEIIELRDLFHTHLTGTILSLDDLNNVLNEMQKISDMESQIDQLYLPVEKMYKVLTKDYSIPLPRKEVEMVNSLRDKWTVLVELSDQVSQNLMREKRPVFEQELDKEVKAFVVEVIQFRNSFDSQGPAIPGISPEEAFVRLKDFQALFKQFDEKKETLHAVQRLFGIQPMPFDELKKTGEELILLGYMYDIFQKFLKLDKKFRDLLWEDANLKNYHEEMKKLWDSCMNLPMSVRNWHQFKELKDSINDYLQIFPVLHKLASKEIRNRHWLQVMQVTKKSFQLEANIFKLNHILDIGLMQHREEIEDILQSSHAELELELKLRHIAEEWSEQVIRFEKLKGKNLLIFNREHTNYLLDALEDGKTSLSVMLTSKYIKPLRAEAASWSVKLNEIGEVLEQWLAVQELWMNLEAVFSNENAVKDLPQQYASFTKADRLYTKLIKMATETSNVVQCCLGTDVSKMVMLRQVYKGLDVCFKGLNEYLDEKRKIYPRFNFVPDEILLSILSKPQSMESVLPFLRETMSAVHNIQVISYYANSQEDLSQGGYTTQHPTSIVDPQNDRWDSGKERGIREVDSQASRRDSAKMKANRGEVVSRLSAMGGTLLENESCDQMQQPTESYEAIVAVIDVYGETMVLDTEVRIEDTVEEWLNKLLKSMKDTVHKKMLHCISDLNSGSNPEDMINNQLCQISLNGLIYYWTRECEKAVKDIRIDRKSCANLSKKFAIINNRLCQALIRGYWRTTYSLLTNIQKRRLQFITGVAFFLRDTFDNLVSHKLRDISDYEWKQTVRCYHDNEEDDCCVNIMMLDNSFSYSHEFLGCKLSLVMSPSTERCFLNLGQAMKDCTAGCVTGPALVGKVEVVKGFACLLGQHLLCVSCTMGINTKALEKIFTGIAEDGSWCCFSNFHLYTKDILSLLHYYMNIIFQCLKGTMENVPVSHVSKMNVLPSAGVFLTTSLTYIHKECPVSFKMLLRNVSILKPDITSILKAWLVAKGFKFAKVLAYNLKSLAEICSDQMTSTGNFILPFFKLVINNASTKHQFIEQKKEVLPDGQFNSLTSTVTTYAQSHGVHGTRKNAWSRVRKSMIPTHLNETFKVEFSIVVQSLNEIMAVRLSDQDLFIYKNVLKSVFAQFAIGEAFPLKFSKEEVDMKAVIPTILRKRGLTVHQPFADKVFQIFQLSQLHHGILLCGPGASGKSTAVSVMIDALQVLATKCKETSLLYKQVHINVLSVANLKLMFGYMDENSDWIDGVFTSVMKKANQQLTVHKVSTWITLDGPLHDDWCSPLKTLVKKEKVFVESNRRSHHLSEHVQIVYETDNLSGASPSVISTMGVCYIDSSVVGWRPLADAWLSGRPSKHIHALQVSFNKTVDQVMQFVQEEAELCLHVSNSVLFTSCLNLLSSLLEDHPELSGDLHIQRLFTFSLIWVFGGLISNENDRHQFNTLVLSLTNVLPDDDRAISVFDYFVDESGEWDTWETRLQETVLEEAVDAFGNIYVETITSIRTKCLLNWFSATENHVLLAGGSCAGKSSFIKNMLQKTVEKNQVTKKVVFSALTDATFLQHIIDTSLHHRQGFVYGAKNNKMLKLFIEDLHLPSYDMCGEQSANELLRQFLDQGVLFTHTKPYKQKNIEGLLVFSTINPSVASSKAEKLKYARLVGKFCTVQLPYPNEKQIYSIASILLQTFMTLDQGLSLPLYLHEKIVEASTKLLLAVSKSLNGCKTQTQSHYLFNIGDLSKVFQNLRRCPEESREDEDDEYLLMFWCHEVKRTFGDRISNTLDDNFLNNTFDEITKNMSSSVPMDVEPLFITFASDAHLRTQRFAVASKQQKKRNTHQRIMTLSELEECLRKYAYRYTNEKNEKLPLVMHNFNFSQLVRLHRALSMDTNGSAILISVQCKQMVSIVKLTTFMLQYELITADCSNNSSFLQCLRGAVRIAGCDNKHCIFMVLASEIKDDAYLEAIHSLLSIGEYAPLFTDNEVHSLLVALLPTIKKSYSTFLSEPKRFFTSCIKRNLHFVLIASPNEDFIFKVQKGYPAIVTTCYIDWLPDASALHLQQEAFAVLSKADFWKSYDEELRSKVLVTCEKVHTHYLKYCKDKCGPQGDMISKPSDALKNKIFICLDAGEENTIEINIITYKRFLHCLQYVLRTKLKEVLEKAKQRKSALDCLAAIEDKCNAMKEEKVQLLNEYEAIDKETERLQEELFAKSTLIERLKGKLDIGTGTFRAFMALMENEEEEPYEEYVFTDDRDELDEEYDKMKSLSHVQIKSLDEKIEELTIQLEDLGKDMTKAQQSLNSFQVKVDRGCIERLRAYQAPPTLVGTIMVMVMILLGRSEFSSYIITQKTEKGDKKLPDSHLSVTYSMNRASSASSRNISNSNTKDKRVYAAGVSSDGKVDRSTWKTIQLIMQDSQKFCEMMNNFDWMKGVSEDILRTVISFFAPGEEFPMTEREDSNIKLNKDNKSAGISLQAARYSSEDAAQMVEYVQQVVNYTCKYRPYHQTLETLNALKLEKSVLEKKKMEGNALTDDVEHLISPAEDDILDSLTEDDLPGLEAELIKLQNMFDSCAMSKYNLKEKIKEFSNLLETTIKLLKSFVPQKKAWRLFCTNLSDGLNILTNVIVSAACMSYGGPFDIDRRKKIRRELYTICSENKVPHSPEDVSENESLMSFLGSEIEMKNFELLWPGTDASLMDLTCYVTQYQCSSSWPLLCDPNQLGMFLLKRLYPQAVVINFYDIQNELELALTQGYFIIVVDIDLNSLLTYSKLRSVIEAHNMFATNTAPFKLTIGDKELDCSPNFRMIMTTTFDCTEVSPELSLLVNNIRFSLSRNALYEIFLNRFMMREKSRLEETLHQVNKEILSQMQSIQVLEEKLLHFLVDKTYFDNISFIRKVLNTKKLLEEATHNKVKSEENYRTVKESREAYGPIAICAAVLFKVSSVMRKINPIYQISINQFLCYFDNSLKFSERSAVVVAAEKVLDSIFFMLSKAKLEKDRPLFGLFTALEIEDCQGRVSCGDREFIISPVFGAAAKQSIFQLENGIPQKLSMKKPFDWMSDEQYQNLLILSQNYEWFTEAFDKMAKDGREMQWRLISEHECPEILTLPDALDEKYTPLQRFMVMRAIRSDRFMQAASVFVSMTLGKKFAVDPILDLEHIYLRSSPSVPILMLYAKEISLSLILLRGLNLLKQVELMKYEISGDIMERDIIMSNISEAIEKGCWLYLCDIHHSNLHTQEIIRAIKNVKSDSTFRLWLSSDLSSQLSVGMLHSCLPIIIDAAKLNLKYSMVQNLSIISTDVWKDIKRPDWFPLLHNLCMLHSTLLQRWRMGLYGVRSRHEFDFDLRKFVEALKFVYKECSKISCEEITTVSRPASALKLINWAGIKAYLLKMVYGREITNPTDYAALNSLIEFWTCSSSQRRDFELQRIHYKHPVALFGGNGKSCAVILAVETIPSSVFESSEFCGLFNIPEVFSSTVTYCLSQLKFLRENMFGSGNLSEATCNIVLDVKSPVSDAEEIALPARRESIAAFQDTPRSLLIDTRLTELAELIPSLLQKMPRLWSKEFVSDRIRKTGGLTAFNMWLLAEADSICVLHFTIKSSLQKIHELLAATSPYYSVSQEIMNDVMDLYHGLVPKRWCDKAGQSCPPQHWNISIWLADFNQRCAHIEKVLMQGRDKFAGYWMAAFFNPRRLIAVVIQEMFRAVRSADMPDEPLVLKTEITNRDKDHLRDPASEGIFIYGLHLWGASREKATNELHDAPPKTTPYSLPVIHLQVVPGYDKVSTYNCPCYVSRLSPDEPVLYIDVEQKDVAQFRWALRGLCCTLRPF